LGDTLSVDGDAGAAISQDSTASWRYTNLYYYYYNGWFKFMSLASFLDDLHLKPSDVMDHK